MNNEKNIITYYQLMQNVLLILQEWSGFLEEKDCTVPSSVYTRLSAPQ